MGRGRARGRLGADPRGDCRLPVSLSPHIDAGTGLQGRKAGRGHSQTVHAVGSRHDEVGGDEGSPAEVASTPL